MMNCSNRNACSSLDQTSDPFVQSPESHPLKPPDVYGVVSGEGQAGYGDTVMQKIGIGHISFEASIPESSRCTAAADELARSHLF